MVEILNHNTSTLGTGRSALVERCQACGSGDLRSILFLGYLPPVNTMSPIGSRPDEQPAYPAEMLHCPQCQLVQLGLVVDPAVIFPLSNTKSYAHTWFCAVGGSGRGRPEATRRPGRRRGTCSPVCRQSRWARSGLITWPSRRRKIRIRRYP